MGAPTYSLRIGENDSHSYYNDVDNFVDDFLRQAASQLQSTVLDFGSTLRELGLEDEAEPDERILELLTLGVMWRVYGARAQRAKPRRLKTLTALASLRYRSRQWKRWVDPARGVLLTIWLKAYRPATATDGQKTPSAPELRRLLDWLRATGEFCEEADRLDPWVDFLARLSPTDFARHFAAISKVTTWFETNSRIALGRYTEGVEDFLRYTQSNRRWREDQVLTGRHRIEYHLNMIGAEIMNRAFAPAFHRRRRKVVLLPECMRKLRDGACQGDPTPLGIQCAGCTPQCSVHQLSCLGACLSNTAESTRIWADNSQLMKHEY